MDAQADVNEEMRTVAHDLEKKALAEAMKTISSKKELIDMVIPNQGHFRQCATLNMMLMVAIAGITSSATFLRASTGKDRSVVFDNEDITTALGCLAVAMQNILSDKPRLSIDKMMIMSTDFIKAVKPFIDIGNISPHK
jgi:hypothetical protein